MSAPDVALISPFPAVGERHGGWTGVASYTANLASALDDAGARVTVLASRRHPASMLPARRPLAREITSAGFAGSVRMLMGLPYLDTQCGAKVLRRHVVRDVLPRLASRDLLFDVDLLSAAHDGGWRVVEVPTVWIDQEGSRVSTVADSRRMGTSLLRLWLRRRMRDAHGRRPRVRA